jgi:hypothetical protein
VSEEKEQETGQGLIVPEQRDEESIQLKINKTTNELTFINPATGKAVTVRAIVEEEKKDDDEEDEEDEDINEGPLSPEEFRTVLNALDELGVTWGADIPPIPRFKKGVEPGQSFGAEYFKIQRSYPNFPGELGGVILAAIMGSKQHPSLVGDEDVLKEKVAILNEVLITPEYRSEFFFKHAIKVPYFEDADWEIVIKAYERAVKPMPKSAYALLSLVFRKPADTTLPIDEASYEYRRPDFVTVAVNKYLLDKLINLLTEARTALGKAQRQADLFEEQIEADEVQTDESS